MTQAPANTAAMGPYNLERILATIGGQLQAFALSDRFWPVWEQCFGRDNDQTMAMRLRQQWLKKDFSELSRLEAFKEVPPEFAQSGHGTDIETFTPSETLRSRAPFTMFVAMVLKEIGHGMDLPSHSAEAIVSGGEHVSRNGEAEKPLTARMMGPRDVDPVSTLSPEGTDLLITEASASATVSAGSALNLTWMIQNNGTQVAASDWRDGIYLSTNATFDANDVFLAAVNAAEHSPLSAGGSYRLSQSLAAPNLTTPGQYYLIIRTDIDSRQEETDETNNTYTVPITYTLNDYLIEDDTTVPIVLDVNTTLDENDGSATIGTGLSLRDAVQIANGNKHRKHVIRLESGASYGLTLNSEAPWHEQIKLQTDGIITIETKGPGPASIVNNQSISVPATGSVDSYSLLLNTGSLVLNNLSLSNKSGRGICNLEGILDLRSCDISGNTAAYGGGGLFNLYGITSISNSTFRENTAKGPGGGIDNFCGILSISNSTISNNQSGINYAGWAGPGGGINGGGGYTSINNCLISNNSSNDSGGGAARQFGAFEITNSRIINNSAKTRGGGIENWGGGGASLLTDNQISGNTAETGAGIASKYGFPSIKSNRIESNHAEKDGGGIWIDDYGEIIENVIADNTSGNGGGISITILDESNAHLSIVNNTISSNLAISGSGGGLNMNERVYREQANPVVDILSNRIVANQARVGAGVRLGYYYFYQSGGAAVNFQDNNISKNIASMAGGGVFLHGNVRMARNTIIDNTAVDYGGGIGNYGLLWLSDNSISGNSASLGGGLFNGRDYYSNTSIAGNQSTSPWYVHPFYPSPSYTHSSSEELLFYEHQVPDDKGGLKTIKTPWKLDPRYPDIFEAGTLLTAPPSFPASPQKPKPSISISKAYEVVDEDVVGWPLTFNVSLSSAYDQPVSFDFFTLDGSASSVDNLQTKDFLPIRKQTLTINPGSTTAQIQVMPLGRSQPTTDQTLEIFARDTAYREWNSADIGKEVDQVVDYADKGYEGYRINHIFQDPITDFEAVGLTSDETFFLVLANPKNADFAPNSTNLLAEVAQASGGTASSAYQSAAATLAQLQNQPYSFTTGTIYDRNKPPVLAIRGTEFDEIKDWLSDITPMGVGYRQFNANKEQVFSWLKQVGTLESGYGSLQPHITGHSLGGALSQWVGATYDGRLGEIVTFNSPGITALAGINMNPSKNEGIRHYITSADLVSMAGATYLDGEWIKSSYQGASRQSIISGILEKHSMPVSTARITRTKLDRPKQLSQIPSLPTEILSSPWFTYLPDPEWFEFQVAIARLGRVLGPTVGVTTTALAAALTWRGTTELMRKSIGTLLDSLMDFTGFLSAVFDASKSFSSTAWNAIIEQSKLRLGLAPSTQIQQNIDLAITNSSFSETEINRVLSAISNSKEITSFWDAIPMWETPAWRATMLWSDQTWNSMADWSPQTWQATTGWTDAEWQKPLIVIANAKLSEGHAGLTFLGFEVSLSHASSQEIRLSYSTTDGTAVAGRDYHAQTGSIVFAPGEISKSISLAIIGDLECEADNYFHLNINNPLNASLVDEQAIVSIENDDLPLISLALAPPTGVGEDGSTNLLYTFTRTGPTTSPLTVNFSVGGTATLGNDFNGIAATPATKTVTFAAGSATAIVTVDPNADTTIEPNETVELSLAAGTGYTIGTTGAVIGTISNDDFPSITLAVTPASVAEDGAANLIYTFSRTGDTRASLTVYYTAAGSATLGSDYTGIAATPTNKSITFAAGLATASLMVDPTADTTIEANETVELTLAAGTGYTIGTPGAVISTISNDDVPSITLAVSPASVAEDGAANLVYTFSRTGDTSDSLTVYYTAAGSATLGSDYTGIAATPATKFITFAAGSATASLTVDPTADTTIEANETVELTLAAGTGYIIGTTKVVIGRINNDDFPSITLAVAPSSGVVEDDIKNLIYTYTRTGDFSGTLSVNYTVGGTATLGTDYSGIAATPATKTVTFAAGSATATVTVDPIADSEIESDETVALSLAAGSGYTIGTTAAVTSTINNDDPRITLTVSPSSIKEDGMTNLIYTFSRTGATINSLAVNYTIGGTATLGTDYSGIAATPAIKTVSFAAGSATAIVTVDPTSDTTIEANETVELTLAAGSGYTIGTTTAAVGTIINDDFPVITLAVSPSAGVTEDGFRNLLFTFSRTGATTYSLAVNYTIGGTATLGTDYSGIAATPAIKTVSFAADSATAIVTVDPTTDTTIEANETVGLTLAAGSGYTIGTTTAVVGTIINDDFPVITLAVSPSAGVTEDGIRNLLFTFSRTGATTNPLAVNYTISGTATLGTDYSGIAPTPDIKTVSFAAGSATAIVTVDPTADSEIESDETVSLSLAAGSGYTIGTTAAVTNTINNDDPRITLTVSPSSIKEDGMTNLIYTFSRTGATTNPLAVNYTIGGTATLGTDYSGIAATPAVKTVSFAAGSATAIVTVDPTADSGIESDETVELTLTAGSGYFIGTTTRVAGTILNDDFPVITLAASPNSVSEDGATNLIYTFSRSGDLSNTLSVNYTVGGTATLGSDYSGIAATPATKTVTFAAGSATAIVTVDPTADSEIESDETVKLTLAKGSGYSIGTTAAITSTINNDDPRITLTVAPASVTEDGTSNMVFSFFRTGATTNPLSVNYTVGGTATLGSDYSGIAATPATKTVTFAAGSATAIVTVDPTADSEIESDETVDLSLAAGSHYTIGTIAAVVGAILNDDVSSLGSYSMGESESSLLHRGRRRINDIRKDPNHAMTGNSSNNILLGATGPDLFMGSGSAESDLFARNSLSESLLPPENSLDVITDFTNRDRILDPASVVTDRISDSICNIPALSASEIASMVGSASLAASSVAAFTASDRPGPFIATNGSRMGYQSESDAILFVPLQRAEWLEQNIAPSPAPLTSA